MTEIGDTLALARYLQVQSVSRSVVAAIQALWRDVPPDRIIAAMQGETGAAILRAVLAGQLSVTEGAAAYVAATMAAEGAAAAPLAALDPAALVGLAADGRPLASLLLQPSITTARGLAAGLSPEAAALRGLTQMAMLASTTIADASRAATSVAMTAHPRVTAYIRVVHAPACGRCIVLANRQYSRSEGFKRHPKCDCSMRPTHELSDDQLDANDPRAILDAMTREQRVRALGSKKAADAYELGSDVGQLVNARRGVQTATVHGRELQITTEGTTRRGYGARRLDTHFEQIAGRRYSRAVAPRLMPEQILTMTGDRSEQLRLLYKHGYLTDPPTV